MPHPASQTETLRRAEFTRLYDGCSEWLYGYLLSLLRRPQDAEEVLQETVRVLWEKFDQYQPNTEFRAWACRVAHFKALKHRQRSRRGPVVFSDLFLSAIEEEVVVMADRLDLRAAELDFCLEKLPIAHRELLKLRYAPGATVESVAHAQGRSKHSVYRSLAKIHDVLFRCINRALDEEADT